jgi:cysteinyl-tRNA synthetase
MRAMVAFDVVQRWLRASGYRVTYVRNITDIDDKIIKRAVENGETIRSLTDRMIAALHQDADALGIERPDHEPRATEYVPQMLGMIGRCRQGPGLPGRQWRCELRRAQVPGYGKLSGKSLDELQAGERVAVRTASTTRWTFVLWKRQADEPAEVKWPSPWARAGPAGISNARPWLRAAGRDFDIHGGGADLQFPHHENEIAQSEGATASRWPAWMHNGFINVDNEKMSKSWATSSPSAMCSRNTTPRPCASSSCAATTAAR